MSVIHKLINQMTSYLIFGAKVASKIDSWNKNWALYWKILIYCNFQHKEGPLSFLFNVILGKTKFPDIRHFLCHFMAIYE